MGKTVTEAKVTLGEISVKSLLYNRSENLGLCTTKPLS